MGAHELAALCAGSDAEHEAVASDLAKHFAAHKNKSHKDLHLPPDKLEPAIKFMTYYHQERNGCLLEVDFPTLKVRILSFPKPFQASLYLVF